MTTKKADTDAGSHSKNYMDTEVPKACPGDKKRLRVLSLATLVKSVF